MNFVKSSQSYQSTDVSHVQDQGFQYRQGFGGGPQGYGYAGPGPRQPSFSMQSFRGPQDRFSRPQGPFMGPRGGIGRPPGRFSSPGSFNQQQQGFGNPPQFSGPSLGGSQPQQNLSGSSRPRFSSAGAQQKFDGAGAGAGARLNPSQYSGFVKPQNAADQFEGGDGGGQSVSTDHAQSGTNRPLSAPSTLRHPYNGPRFPCASASRTTGRFATNVEGGGPMRAGGRGFGRGGSGPRFGGGSGRGGGFGATSDNFSSVEAANAAAARATREATNPNAKCVVLAANNVHLSKFRRLAEEIKKLKSKRPNAIDTIHSAANIAHVSIQSEIESGPIVRGTGTFFCLVQFDGVNISVCSGLNKRSAKNEAFDVALQKLMKPYQRIVEVNGSSKELQASDYDFPAEPPKQTVIKPTSAVVANISGDGGDSMENAIQRESNVEALVDIKKKSYVAKELSDFVLVEPQDHNSSVNGASILRRSADFSKMLLEYDFAAHGSGGAVRCVLKVEGQVLADVIAYSKMASKIEASQKAVDVLRQQCWTILTKQVHDSNAPEITKEEMLADLASSVTSSSNAASMATPIADSNLGKKLLQKMGWTGGGIGKDGMGIEEPVTMKQVINREGLGLDAKRGITGDFRARITEVLENYASSERQDDLVFSPHFRKDERIIIHNECRRLNLKSKSNGQGNTRYLIVRRKRSASQLLAHVMECGGETARYKVVPPGQRKYPWRPMGPSGAYGNAGAPKAQGAGASHQGASGLLGPSPAAGAAAPANPRMLAAQGALTGLLGQNLAGLQGLHFHAGAMGQPPTAGRGGVGQNPAGVMCQNPALRAAGPNSAGLLGQRPPVGVMGQNAMGPRG